MMETVVTIAVAPRHPVVRVFARLVALFILGLALVNGGLFAANSFPKPNPEKVFPELKLYDSQGQPWRTAQEDWNGAQRRVREDAAWSAWVTKERATVDAWIAKHHDRVEWVAGWSHDGVSPKDGSRVSWTEKIPGEQVDFLSSPSDPKIALTPKLRAWWVVTFRGRHVDTMVRAAQLFRLTGETRYAEWAAGQMDFYADNLLQWEIQRPEQGARLFWQTLTEATNLVNFVEVVRVLGGYASTERRERWKTKFFAPEVETLNKNFQAIHNIATWQRCAVAQVALLFDDQEMWRNAIDGKFGLRRQIAEGITDDYLWWEQSFGYNSYVVQAVLTLFTSAGLYGRAAELSQEMSVAENLMLSPLYLRFPNGQLPNPADNIGILTAPNLGLFADAYRVFPTTLGLSEAAKRKTWDTLVDPPESRSPLPHPVAIALPLVTTRILGSSQMALLKSGSWQVFFHYGQLTRSHSQAEALNFSAFYGDVDITHDTGVVGYGSPLYKGYYTRGLNHNVPLLNGEGEEPPQAGELLSYSVADSRVSAAQLRYRGEARARRTLVIEGDRLTDTASLQSGAKTPQLLGLAVQLQGRVHLPAEFASDSEFTVDRPDSFKYWKNPRSAQFRDRAEFDVDYGKLTMRVTIAVPGTFKIWHATTPDAPPAQRESFYVEIKGLNATFTTTFEPKK